MNSTKERIFLVTALFFALSSTGCDKPHQAGTFGYDLDFLQALKQTIVLKNNGDKCQVAIIGDYQGRVMTSTGGGLAGNSYGWINYDLISSGEFKEHMNAFGGEDRFWLGPEGGQYSIFFEKGSEFTLDNWHTPKSIDTEPFDLAERTESTATFEKEIHLTNYHGYDFSIDVTRTLSLLEKSEIEQNLDMTISDELAYVAFQSENVIENTGMSVWTREQGLLSIWILGMFIPTDNTTVVIPYRGSLALNTSYFGEIGPDRLKVLNNTVLFKADGRYRSKIGVPPGNVKPIAGSFDAEKGVLTIVEFTFEGDTTYVNSLWEIQDKPYGGDVINSYNDGPLENGEQLGPFYELESSSSSREVAPGESIRHVHKTYHFEGERTQLDAISGKILGIGLNEIKI